MSNELNHECIVCGVKYHHCDSCEKMKSINPWRIICDTSEHYQIYMTAIGYRDGFINKEEAKNELDNIHITLDSIVDFKDSIKGLLTEILSETDTAISTEKVSIKK